MKKYVFILFVVIGFISFFSFAEDITITTYYPAPYGVYKSVKLHNLVFEPQDTVPDEPTDGMLFFSSGKPKDSKGEPFYRGLWIYFDRHWRPIAISFDLNSLSDIKGKR